MTKRLRDWLTRKWQRLDPKLAEDYRVTFSTLHGQRVLHHLLDHVYCQVYQGHDPIEAATHNGRRSLVQEILENIDASESPKKYDLDVTQEGVPHV